MKQNILQNGNELIAAKMTLPITIGVPTYLREESLIRTLEQILQLEPAAVEVIIMDQTTEHRPETEATLRSLEQRGIIRWVHQEKPSLCRARNRILAEAKSDWVLFLDDDVLFQSSLLADYLKEIQQGNGSAYVGEVYQVPAFAPWMLEAGAIDRMPFKDYSHYNRQDRMSVDFLRGCNFIVHRETAIRIGGFDEALFGSVYGDEMDFAIRLLQAAKEIRFLTKPWLVHLSAPAGGCRIGGTTHFPEWQKTYCSWLLLFRHRGYRRSADNLFGGKTWWFFWAILRVGPLRRENVLKPSRWFAAWKGALEGAWRGFHAARSGVHSPFLSSS
jgi:glycosyltransferase involved in cell wall biosynthesis